MEVETGAETAGPDSKDEMQARMKRILEDMRKSLTTPVTPRLSAATKKPVFRDRALGSE